MNPGAGGDLFAEQIFSWRMQMGGKLLIAVFRSV